MSVGKPDGDAGVPPTGPDALPHATVVVRDGLGTGNLHSKLTSAIDDKDGLEIALAREERGSRVYEVIPAEDDDAQ